MTNKTTIHVVDDDSATRDYLIELISSIDYEVKTYHSAVNFLEQYQDNGIGCLILDIRLPGISGLDLQQKLEGHGIDLPVIMISGHADVPTAVRAMKAGALDVIEKPFSAQLLLERIQKAVNQHQQLRELSSRTSEIVENEKSLTRREREVMNHVVNGMQNKDVANELGISIKTVEVHRANVMEKMKANSIVELVRMNMLINSELSKSD